MLTRYPENYVDIANAGDDGDTAAGFMSKRFKYDVQDKEAVAAFVCFGANDAGATSYYADSTASDALKAEMIRGAKANLERVILALQAEGVTDITLLTPVTYDDRENFTYGDNGATVITKNCVNYSSAMALVAANVLDLAEQYDLKVVDTNSITAAIMEDAINDDFGGEVIYQPDRIHPNTRGHFVIASKIIETLYGADALVASVEIDAASADFYAENADVSELSVSDGGVSYTYLAKSLPMGVDDAGYKAVHENYGEFVNFTESMNQEIIKITNLADGIYTIAFDGSEIGEYSAQELSKGVNIAVNPLNPGQIAAKGIIDSLMANLYNKQRVRIFEIVENALKRAGKFYGTTMEEKIAWAQDNQPNYKNAFRLYYPEKAEYISKVNKLKKNVYAKAQPVAHTVTVIPVAQ